MRFRSPLVIAGAVAIAFAGAVRADDASDLKAKFEALQKQMEEVKNQLEQVTKKQKEQEAAAAAKPAAPAEKKSPAEALIEKLTKGFYGSLEVSVDYVTKGMKDKAAGSGYGWTPSGGFTGPTGIKSTVLNPATGATTIHPVGNVGYVAGLSTNKSGFGYRGDHSLPFPDTKVIYQIEANFAITAQPGVASSYTQQSNVVKTALGFGDSYLGVGTKDWGNLKFGTLYAPYNKSTDRMNPFSGMLGDYAVVMGNSGGDNRVEFGTRLEHSILYESPKIFPSILGGFSFDVLYSPGQNRTNDYVVQSSGSPDCNGGNLPGSGNLPLNCDDGGFDSAWSLDLKYERPEFYITAAYERHQSVNRNSDGIGSNNPIYGYFAGLPGNPLLLDLTPVMNVAANGGAVVGCGPGGTSLCPTTIPLGAYTTDIGNETAYKFGAQYIFPFGLTVSGIWENLIRDIPGYLQFQNERSRHGSWLALSQSVTPDLDVSFGWAHASQTPGDPGGQHNYSPFAPSDTADMFTLLFKQKIDKQVFWYVNAAETFNHGNVHYDLGAGGRGFPTDCHDGTHTTQVDYTGFGPTTWGGCKLKGLSVGMNYKF
jgi:predicted porin